MGIKERIRKLRETTSSASRRIFYDVVIGLAVAGVAAGGIWAWKRLMKYLLVTTVFSPADVSLISAFVAMLIITTISVTWAVVATRHLTTPRSEALDYQDPTERKIRIIVPTLPTPPTYLSALSSKDPDIHIEIREVILRAARSALLSGSGCDVLMQLHMVNRGSIEATVTEWKLKVSVGAEHLLGKVAPIPTALYIERPRKGALAALAGDSPTEQISRPTLDEAAREPFKRGIPKDGWIMFFAASWGIDYEAPYNAEFTLTVTDSMGVEHTATKAPSFYKVNGEIKFLQSPRVSS